MTRRSSTLGLPRVSVGRFGSSRANCPALSQKQSRSIDGLPSETLNQKKPGLKSPFMGPEPSAGARATAIADAWRKRWLASRINQPNILDRLANLGPSSIKADLLIPDADGQFALVLDAGGRV